MSAGLPRDSGPPHQRELPVRSFPPASTRGLRSLLLFFEPFGAAILNIRPWDMILVKENVIQLAHVDHFAALFALVEVPFFRFA